jgi:Lamin Tail Domain
MWMRNVAIFLCCLFTALFATRSVAQIRINEIVADPASDWDGDTSVNSRSDEWVEIVNAGSSTIDISTFRLGDLSGGSDWRYGFAGTLAPGETRVVYGSVAVAWESANGFPAVGLSLNNGGDTVFLYDLAGADTVVSDEYTYMDFEVTDDRSTGRSPDGVGPWVIFDALNPYGGENPPLGNGCPPTPGAPNECSSTVPTEESTWGAIKALYGD